MSSTTNYDREKGEEEHLLDLPGGRQLAYAHNGPATSRTIVICFTGLFAVGNAADVPTPCRELGVHWIHPSLPGFGKSSTRDLTLPYHVGLSKDMTALLLHLYPTSDYDAIYLMGGSYGTVQAQMLYGAPYEQFPPGRKIVGCILLAGISPFYYDRNYAKALSWQNWASIGPPSQLPLRPLQRLVSTIVASKFKTLEGARAFLRSTIFGHMDADEKEKLAQWLKKKDKTEDTFVDQMARGAIRCCHNWDGFMEVSDVLHSDWGFEPKALDDEHASKPVLIVGSEKDHLGSSNNGWMAENYRSAKLKLLPGGHISSIFYMDDIWQEIIEGRLLLLHQWSILGEETN